MPVYRSTAVISHPSLGGNGTNTWHARTDSLAVSQDAQLQDITDVIEAFCNGCNDVLAGGTLITHDGVWVRVDDPPGEVRDIDGFSSLSGTSQAPLPPSQCLVVGWGTAQAGRRARGRTFVGPLGLNTLQDNGTPTEASRTALEGHAATLVAASEATNDWAIGVWSEVDGVLRDFTRAAVANKFSVLRSRRD